MTRAHLERWILSLSTRSAQRSFHASSQPSMKNCTLKIRLPRTLTHFHSFSFSWFYPKCLDPSVSNESFARASRLYILPLATFATAGIRELIACGKTIAEEFQAILNWHSPSGIARWLKMVPIIVFLIRNSMDLYWMVTAKGLWTRSSHDTRPVTFGTILGNRTACNRTIEFRLRLLAATSCLLHVHLIAARL